MGRISAAELREAIRSETAKLQQLAERRDAAQERYELARAEFNAARSEYATVLRQRDRHMRSARTAGVLPADLAADTGLSPSRVRQIAPGKSAGAGGGRRPQTLAESGLSVVVASLVEDAAQTPARAAEDMRRAMVRESHRGPVDQAPAQVIGATSAGTTPAAAGAKVKPMPIKGPFTIAERVDQALRECGGDIAAAQKLLIAGAVDDAMALLDRSRAGGRYDYTAFPSLPAPLVRPGRKQADMIWEGRPRFLNPEIPAGTVVHKLDVNGAYLAALRRVHLPIGRLQQDADPAVFEPKRAGIYLIEPPVWPWATGPDPLGNGRTAKGPVWVTTPTLRLLHRAHGAGSVRILESWTSGASESLLGKLGDMLAAARREALAAGDDLTVEYVKALYSRFVSTAGDSAVNHDLRRPEWAHAIRSQAFANLWYRAEKAAAAGLLIYRMSGTDELWVAGDWRAATYMGKPVFVEGRDLSQVKTKGTEVVPGA